MKLVIRRNEFNVLLSERNLLSLLSKLYTKGSYVGMYSNDCLFAYTHEGDPEPVSGLLIVRGQTDKEHYEDREEPPGEMHPVTEIMLVVLDAIKNAGFERDNDGQYVLYIEKELGDRLQDGI